MSFATQIPSHSPAQQQHQHQLMMEQMKLNNQSQNVGQTNSINSANSVNVVDSVAKTISSVASSSQNLKALLPSVPPQCGPPTVSLALLLDFAIHQTAHELQVLYTLNLQKKAQDRTISVVQFAHSTRLVFVRLLAIVRWLKTNRKFEPLSSIRFLLDEQAARYVETADKLVEIARNELPNARLSVFHVPQAVDDRFVSTPPLAGREQRLTLRELNRVLEFHLAQSARQLSPRIEQINIKNGMPLFDAYNILHVFCRSLQLDVIYCQATLIAKISSLYIRVEEQIHHYRFTIYGDKTDPHSTLRVKHHPAGPELPKLDQSFSLQRLLNETILFRCRERLLQAQNLVERAQPKPAKITRVKECITAEALIISVNTFFGTVNCRVEALGRRDEINELEKQLNAASPSIKIIVNLLDRLRILILMERLQRAIVGLQVNKLNDNQALSLANKLTTLPKDRSIFQFIREDQFYLIIAFMPDDQTGVKIQFHLFSSTDGRLTMLDLDAEQ
uniref:Mediator of RNA polymerase II transcription subunit 14 n=1 Tax=Meloidogyne floridensis TaxID=298350 RepID=A0A915PG75_9BILA